MFSIESTCIHSTWHVIGSTNVEPFAHLLVLHISVLLPLRRIGCGRALLIVGGAACAVVSRVLAGWRGLGRFGCIVFLGTAPPLP